MPVESRNPGFENRKSSIETVGRLQQQLLGRNQASLPTGVQEHLLTGLLEYEFAKVDLDSTLLRPRAKEMVDAVLGLEKDLSALESEDLINLQRAGSDAEIYRQEPVQPLNPAHQPLDPAMISNALGRFFEWARSPSFSEIHAIEQMTLAQIRLCEIQPFQEHSHLTVSLFCLYFILTKGYLIPLFRVEELPDFHKALEQAFRFSTEELAHFNARACRRSYEYALKNL